MTVCPPIEKIAYKDFSDQFHQNVRLKGLPLHGALELTTHCNLRCVHCYIQDNTTSNELTYQEICTIIEQIVDAGCLWFLLTGGEPLVRDDFLDIYSFAKSKGLLMTIFTNGTLITEEIADYFSEFPPFSIEISLYGYTQETYEKITGVSGSYHKCLRGIDLLKSHNLPLKLKTMVLTTNRHELLDMKRFSEELGLDFNYDPCVNPTLKKSMEPAKYRLSPDELVELERRDTRRSSEWITLWNKFREPQKTDIIFDCGAGKNSFHINPEGNLQVCGLVQSPCFNIRRNKFLEHFKRFEEIIMKSPGKNYTCGGCGIAVLCDYCPGWSDLETGDSEIKVDYLCDIAHKRHEVFNNSLDKGGVQS